MGFTEEMTNLGQNCMDSFNERLNFVGKNMAETHRLRLNAQKFLRHLKNERKEMSRKLKTDLHNFTNHLTNSVDQFLGRCRKHQRELHTEFKGGHQAFQRFCKTMNGKKRNFFGTVHAKFKQEMRHTPRPKH